MYVHDKGLQHVWSMANDNLGGAGHVVQRFRTVGCVTDGQAELWGRQREGTCVEQRVLGYT
jgi:hypothetical protein